MTVRPGPGPLAPFATTGLMTGAGCITAAAGCRPALAFANSRNAA